MGHGILSGEFSNEQHVELAVNPLTCLCRTEYLQLDWGRPSACASGYCCLPGMAEL